MNSVPTFLTLLIVLAVCGCTSCPSHPCPDFYHPVPHVFGKGAL